MSTYASRAAFGTALRDALNAGSKAALAALVHRDFVWALPGANLVSGETVSVDGMFGRLERLAGFGVNIQIQHVLTSPNGVALILHNTGTHDGRVLDEYLVSAVSLRDGKADRIDTYISDIPMMDAYFV